MEKSLGQRDQIGQFLKFSATTFNTKVTQIFGKLFGHFEKHYFKVKSMVSTFLATFEEIRLLFILPSGHTGLGQRMHLGIQKTERSFDGG